MKEALDGFLNQCQLLMNRYKQTSEKLLPKAGIRGTSTRNTAIFEREHIKCSFCYSENVDQNTLECFDCHTTMPCPSYLLNWRQTDALRSKNSSRQYKS